MENAAARALAGRVLGKITLHAPLRNYSRWRVGGPAALLFEPASADDLRSGLRALQGYDGPRLIIGDGSNLLFDDAGFDGVVIRIGQPMSAVTFTGTSVYAEAGIWVPHFARMVGCRGLTGIEHTVGIPGTLGGLILMNGGSQRKGIGAHVVSVDCVNNDGDAISLTHEECQFSYRHSSLQEQPLIITGAKLAFTEGDPSSIRREMIQIMASRRAKFPKNLPNCGSVFLSSPELHREVGPPGFAIEQAGLKGLRLGDAQISPMHANFIVNLGNAQASDILGLIHKARTEVHRRTGFWMDCEVRHVLPDGRQRMAHISGDELRLM